MPIEQLRSPDMSAGSDNYAGVLGHRSSTPGVPA